MQAKWARSCNGSSTAKGGSHTTARLGSVMSTLCGMPADWAAPPPPAQESRLLIEVVEVHMRRGSQVGGDSLRFWGLLSLVDPNK